MKSIQKLTTDLRKAESKGDFVKSFQIRAELSKLRQEKENVQLGDYVKMFTPDERKKMTDLTFMIGVCSDLISGYCADMNAIIKRYDSTANIEMFKELVQIGEKARKSNSFFTAHKDNNVNGVIAELSQRMELILDTQIKLNLGKVLKVND